VRLRACPPLVLCLCCSAYNWLLQAVLDALDEGLFGGQHGEAAQPVSLAWLERRVYHLSGYATWTAPSQLNVRFLDFCNMALVSGLPGL